MNNRNFPDDVMQVVERLSDAVEVYRRGDTDYINVLGFLGLAKNDIETICRDLKGGDYD